MSDCVESCKISFDQIIQLIERLIGRILNSKNKAATLRHCTIKYCMNVGRGLQLRIVNMHTENVFFLSNEIVAKINIHHIDHYTLQSCIALCYVTC